MALGIVISARSASLRSRFGNPTVTRREGGRAVRLSGLRVRSEFVQAVAVAFNGEVETPCGGDARLPQIVAAAVLLGAKRWVVEVLKQECRLLVERPLDRERRFLIAASEMRREGELHHRTRFVGFGPAELFARL